MITSISGYSSSNAKSIAHIGVANGQYPERLYKFYRLNKYLLSSVANQYLWFDTFENYNDPYEGKCNVKTRYTRKEIQNWLSKKYQIRGAIPAEFFKSFRQTLNEGIEKAAKGVRVCCFTKGWENLLLWAHYADSYRGVCFEFDTTLLPDATSLLLPVKYKGKYKTVDYLRNEGEVALQMATTKANAWKYEEEFRLVRPNNSVQKVPFNMSALSAVIVGPKCDVNGWYFRRLKNMLPPHVEIRYSDIDPKRYRLIIKEVAQVGKKK